MSRDEAQPTRAVTAGRRYQGASLNVPLWANSTWQTEGLDDTRKRATGMRPGDFYSRYANPTVRAFEEAIAELEGAEDALAFASGMGAIASTVFALCSAGDHIVAQRQLYAGTVAFLQGPCARLGIEVTFVDGTEPGALAAAVVPGRTMLVISETPSNPRLDLVDLDEIGAIVGPYTIVDSTFATPIGQQPLGHGVDLVAPLGDQGHLRPQRRHARCDRRGERRARRDLGLRRASRRQRLPLRRPQRTAGHPHARRPPAPPGRRRPAGRRGARRPFRRHRSALPRAARPPPARARRKQLDVLPTVLAADLAGGVDAARAMLDAMRVGRPATSLGGPETLVCHPATSTHVSLSPAEQAAIGITPGLVRISIGLEDADDVITDLCRAIPS